MDLAIGILLVGTTFAASWGWQRYRNRMLSVGRRSAWLRRKPAVRVESRSTAWAKAATAERSCGESVARRAASRETAVSFRAGGKPAHTHLSGTALLEAPPPTLPEEGSGPAGAELEDLREQVAALQPEVRRRDNRIVDLERRMAEQQSTLALRKQQTEQMRAKLEAAERATAERDETIALKDEAIGGLEAMLAESHRALARERERVTVLEKKRSDRAREAQLLRDEVRSLDAAIGHLNERLIDAQRRAKSASDGTTDAATEEELEQRAKRIAELEERLRVLSDDLQESHTLYRQREQHIDRLEQNIAEFAKQVRQRDQRVAELVQAVRTAERVADAQSDRVRDLLRRIEGSSESDGSARVAELEATLASRERRISRLSRAYRASRRKGRVPSDDLKRIRGIGPAIERKLRAAGIDRLEQLAALTSEGVAGLSAELAGYVGRAAREDWVGQAARLARDGSGSR